MSLADEVYELIVRASTDLPADVEGALEAARSAESEGSPGREVLDVLLENIKVAREKKLPMCQDTGVPTFYVTKPAGVVEENIVKEIHAAVKKATGEGLLRPNAVDTVSGKNSGDNIGAGSPIIKFMESRGDGLEIKLLLKGGGSENISTQYKLPNPKLDAGRDMDGVRKCALDAVASAQGRGCPPGILAIVAGGDRALGFEHAKKMFFRKIGERSGVKELAILEEKILADANKLGVGPAGLGGACTLLDVKADALSRNPPSYFVTVAYNCWPLRRWTLKLAGGRAEYE